MYTVLSISILNPAFRYWVGIVLGSGLNLLIICWVIDNVWQVELTKAVHFFVWEVVLRRLLRIALGGGLVGGAYLAFTCAVGLYSDPWKSMAYLIVLIPTLRVVTWFFWMLSAQELRFARATRDRAAKEQGLTRWKRFVMWCFFWDQYQGLNPKNIAFGPKAFESAHE